MKTMLILDTETHDRVLRVLAAARWRGVPAPTLLNQEGLLWTPDREKRIRADTIKFIINEMDTWSPAQFLRRKTKSVQGGTPVDMYMCIREWLQDHFDHAQAS
jgi:hypothetical protein